MLQHLIVFGNMIRYELGEAEEVFIVLEDVLHMFGLSKAGTKSLLPRMVIDAKDYKYYSKEVYDDELPFSDEPKKDLKILGNIDFVLSAIKYAKFISFKDEAKANEIEAELIKQLLGMYGRELKVAKASAYNTYNSYSYGNHLHQEEITSQHNKNDNDEEIFSVSQIANYNNLSAIELNLFLEHLGIQKRVNGKWVLRDGFKNLGLESIRQIRAQKDGRLVLHMYWTRKGLNYINNLISTEYASYKKEKEKEKEREAARVARVADKYRQMTIYDY